ncbi:MAG: hypothetical protein ACFFDN_47985, partial [Candidatus Hodarchaeota archaeon]
ILNKTTSNESLQSLENLIKEFKNKFKPIKKDLKEGYFSKTWTRKFVKTLDYQFGFGSGDKIISNGLKPVRIRANEQIDLKDLKTQEKLGVFRFSTGYIELTLIGLKKLVESPPSFKSNFIVFNGEEIHGNTLFRAGVLEYSLDLIPNNQVVILDKGKEKIIGSGELIVGSNFLKNSKSGRIVRINEKI